MEKPSLNRARYFLPATGRRTSERPARASDRVMMWPRMRASTLVRCTLGEWLSSVTWPSWSNDPCSSGSFPKKLASGSPSFLMSLSCNAWMSRERAPRPVRRSGSGPPAAPAGSFPVIRPSSASRDRSAAARSVVKLSSRWISPVGR